MQVLFKSKKQVFLCKSDENILTTWLFHTKLIHSEKDSGLWHWWQWQFCFFLFFFKGNVFFCFKVCITVLTHCKLFSWTRFFFKLLIIEYLFHRHLLHLYNGGLCNGNAMVRKISNFVKEWIPIITISCLTDPWKSSLRDNSCHILLITIFIL